MTQKDWMMSVYEELNQLRTLDEFYQHLTKFYASMEMEQSLYTVLPHYADLERGPLTCLTNFSLDWMEHYLKNRYDQHDRAFIHCLSGSDVPYVKSQDPGFKNSSFQEKRVINEADDAGIKNLISIPLHNTMGSTSIISVALDATANDFEKYYAEKKNKILTYANIYNEVIHRNTLSEMPRFFAEQYDPELTPKEIETLKFLIEGHTYSRVADLMNISVKTTQNNVYKLTRKLKARNTTHACALAFRWGLII